MRTKNLLATMWGIIALVVLVIILIARCDPGQTPEGEYVPPVVEETTAPQNTTPEETTAPAPEYLPETGDPLGLS
jgi:hypothetical protein